MFTCGTFVYIVSSKEKDAILIESYDPNFKLVNSVTLLDCEGKKSFAASLNIPNLLKTSQFATNGNVVSIKISND
jgi:hypothetical protein